MMRLYQLFSILALAGGMVSAAPGQGRAMKEGGWLEAPHSAVRLTSASGVPYRGRLRTMAAIQFQLATGWKTYWRTAGDGLPPMFDWSGSTNLKQAQILWPAPKRLKFAGGVLAFGYKTDFTLPVLLEPDDVSRPIELKLDVNYGVCSDICIPVSLTLRRQVPATPHITQKPMLESALARVPKKQARGIYCPHSFVTAKRRELGGKPALLIKTAFQDGVSGLDLFVEGPDGLGVPPPIKQPRSSRGRLYHILSFEDDEHLKTIEGENLTLTMVADQGSCEATWRVK